AAPHAGTAPVSGNGARPGRRRGHRGVHPAGGVVDLATLGSTDAAPVSFEPGPGGEHRSDDGGPGGETPTATGPAATSLRAATDEIAARFDAALERLDVDGVVAAVLDLEQTLVDWSADTLTSDEGEYARGQLRRMVLRLGEIATTGARDPRDVLGPFVTDLIELRARARAARDFATSDWIRDRLGVAGVEVRDTPDGAEWHLR
ncbi:MAG: hypothetical protein ACM30G_13130, partial [Micromonosporaceae bacterium]